MTVQNGHFTRRFALGQSDETLCKVILRVSHESAAARREFEKNHQISHNFGQEGQKTFIFVAIDRSQCDLSNDV